MFDLGIFLGKFFWRLLKLSGIVTVAQSMPVNNLVHSPIVVGVVKWLPLMVVILAVSGEIIIPKSNFEIAKETVNKNFSDPKGHFKLAQTAGENNDYILAETEFRLASNLSENGLNNVLGLTSEMNEIRKAVFPQEAVSREIAGWEKLISTRPNFRDGLLNLAVRYWQIDNNEAAQKNFVQARKLDPNNKTVQKVNELLEEK